jgi:hypothetical protein
VYINIPDAISPGSCNAIPVDTNMCTVVRFDGISIIIKILIADTDQKFRLATESEVCRTYQNR